MQLNQLAYNAFIVLIFYNSVILKSVNLKRFKCIKKASILECSNWNFKFL